MADAGRAVARWLAALETRHRTALNTAEFLRAVRALSARYVERRAALPGRSPLDSAGKRAAFAAFYAPLHFLTVRGVLASLGPAPAVATILDLGCGSGAASAAWALAAPRRPRIEGVDRHGWAVAEAAWTWRTLGLAGVARRGELVAAAERRAAGRSARGTSLGVLLAWSANELDEAARARLLRAVAALAGRGAAVLVIEPLARGAAPWWDEWAAALAPAGIGAREWRLEAPLPAPLARLDAAAGFRRDGLTARTLASWPPAPTPCRG